jgi:hypothetical protein
MLYRRDNGGSISEWLKTLSNYIEVLSRIYLSSCYVNVDFLRRLSVVGGNVEIVCC